jgi:hypothetical protein
MQAAVATWNLIHLNSAKTLPICFPKIYFVLSTYAEASQWYFLLGVFQQNSACISHFLCVLFVPTMLITDCEILGYVSFPFLYSFLYDLNIFLSTVFPNTRFVRLLGRQAIFYTDTEQYLELLVWVRYLLTFHKGLGKTKRSLTRKGPKIPQT